MSNYNDGLDEIRNQAQQINAEHILAPLRALNVKVTKYKHGRLSFNTKSLFNYKPVSQTVEIYVDGVLCFAKSNMKPTSVTGNVAEFDFVVEAKHVKVPKNGRMKIRTVTITHREFTSNDMVNDAFNDIWHHHYGTIKEAYFVSKDEGIVPVTTQREFMFA